MSTLNTALIATVTAFGITSAAADPQPAWMHQAKACVAEYEKHYPTLGDWIYSAAACTARRYPPTSNLPHERVQACANRVYQQTYHLCQACGPDRIDAVMDCLGAR